MDSALLAALAFDRRLRERTASDVHYGGGVTVIRDATLTDVHYLNAVLVHAGATVHDAPTAVALAEQCLAGRPDLHVAFDDAALGEHIAGELDGAGWARERTLYMAHNADAHAPGRDRRAREITEAQARALEAVSLAEEVPRAAVASGLLDRLVTTARRRRAANVARCFGAGEDGGLGAMCTLFTDDTAAGRVAMIEGVGTLVAHRRRGLARAVVSAAIDAARSWQAQLILVPADADDWPQIMYAGLGFAGIGVQVSLTRAGPRPAPRAPVCRPDAV